MIFARSDTTAVSALDPTCTGSWSDPTAPPNQVCLYLVEAKNALVPSGFRYDAAPRRAFEITWSPAGGVGKDMVLDVVWAYTAP